MVLSGSLVLPRPKKNPEGIEPDLPILSLAPRQAGPRASILSNAGAITAC